MAEKRIEVCRMRAGDLKTDFGNPRKVSKAKLKELEESIKTFGDFGIFLIDEHDNVIGGNQRLKAILSLYGPDEMIDCKRLIGFTKSELRAVNIKDNTHAGEWDLELLADWTADITLDLGVELENGAKVEERKIDEMELIHYEKYDYVLIVCRDELSYNSLVRTLGIEEKKTLLGPKKRKIKARAIWYDDLKVDLVPKKYDEQTSVPVYNDGSEASQDGEGGEGAQTENVNADDDHSHEEDA